MSATIPDGAGGFMSQELPGAGEVLVNFAETIGSAHWAAILTYLNAIFGETACKGQGVKDTPVTGMGSGSWGSV